MTRRRPGFTLIELLIVVVIIGILAAIAIPRFNSTKGKAFLATMKSDLHNITTAQEAFFYDSAKYTTNMSLLAFSPTQGNQIVLVEGTPLGWSATATNPQAYPHFCAIFVGSAAPVAPATVSGAVACQ